MGGQKKKRIMSRLSGVERSLRGATRSANQYSFLSLIIWGKKRGEVASTPSSGKRSVELLPYDLKWTEKETRKAC